MEPTVLNPLEAGAAGGRDGNPLLLLFGAPKVPKDGFGARMMVKGGGVLKQGGHEGARCRKKTHVDGGKKGVMIIFPAGPDPGDAVLDRVLFFRPQGPRQNPRGRKSFWRFGSLGARRPPPWFGAGRSSVACSPG